MGKSLMTNLFLVVLSFICTLCEYIFCLSLFLYFFIFIYFCCCCCISLLRVQDSLHSLFNLMTRSDLRLAAIPALAEGLWPTVGRETMTLATEFGCTGEANRYLTAAATHFPGFVGLDADGFIVHVVTPLSADVARLQD